MILWAKDEELIFGIVPVCTNASENGSPIVEGMSQDTHLCLFVRYYASIEEHKLW